MPPRTPPGSTAGSSPTSPAAGPASTRSTTSSSPTTPRAPPPCADGTRLRRRAAGRGCRGLRTGVPDIPVRRPPDAPKRVPRALDSPSRRTWPRSAHLVERNRGRLVPPRGVRRATGASGCTSGRWCTGRRSGRRGTTGRSDWGPAAPTRSWSRTGSRAPLRRLPVLHRLRPRPLNTLDPGRDDRADFEQPGCLHAGMDLYKHAFRLSPLIASELVADCFELAWDIRELDMRASPYDFSRPGLRAGAHRDARGQAGLRRRPARLHRAGCSPAPPARRGVRPAAPRRPIGAMHRDRPSATAAAGDRRAGGT